MGMGVDGSKGYERWWAAERAAEDGDAYRLGKALDGLGSEEGRFNRNGMDILAVAAGSGSEECVGMLLGRGWDVSSSGQGVPPLATAIAGGHTRVVAMLLAAGADPNGRCPQTMRRMGGKNMLEVACEGRKAGELTKMLLAAGATPWEEGFRVACSNGKTAAVRAMLSHPLPKDADVMERILRVAARSGQRAAVRRLAGECAALGVNMDGALGSTWDRGIASILLAAGANPMADMGRGATMLHMAAARHAAGMAEVLLAAGADPRVVDDGGVSAVGMALRHKTGGTERFIRVLLAAGVSPDEKTGDGSPLICEAARNANAGAVRSLLAAGADMGAVDETGETALHKAARTGRVDIMGLLLSAGADMGAVDKTGETALHKAARARDGAVEAVVFLLGEGADPGVANMAGYLPEDMARKGPRGKEAARLLTAAREAAEIGMGMSDTVAKGKRRGI